MSRTQESQYRSFVASILLLLSLLASGLHAYETDTTHTTLAGISADRSVLSIDPSILTSLGLQPYGTNAFQITSIPSEFNTVRELIQLGTIEEDVGLAGAAARVQFHFYDPQHDVGLTIVDQEYRSSPDWALEDDSAISAQDFSYRDARTSFLGALTSPNPTDREYLFGQTFLRLGHVVHHIQDMGQPQHTRDEIHCDSKFWCDWILEFFIDEELYRPSTYEEYAALQNDRVISGEIPTTTYPLQSVSVAQGFLEPRDYWVHASVFGGGMSEFTSHNFLTVHSVLEYNPAQNAFRADVNFPLPDGTTIQLSNVPCTVEGSKAQDQGICTVVETSITDNIASLTQFHRIARTSTHFAPLMRLIEISGQSNEYYRYMFMTDNTVFDSRLPILFPRIVAFSTGIIDYFFRGKPNLVFDPDGQTWRIRNDSAEVMDGQFQLYSDTAAGQRTQITNLGWDSRHLTLSPGQSSGPILFEQPVGNGGDFILVFSGRLGNEGSVLNNSLTAVAGKKIALPTITITYGDNGPALDDIFQLSVDGVVLNSMTIPTAEVIVPIQLRPGPHTVSITYLADVVGPDDGGTYYVGFSPNVQVTCCGSLSGGTGGEGSSGQVITWQVNVLQN